MIQPQPTREFSICLLPGEATSADIQALRSELPPSPYRDDMPHITLLWGITTPEHQPDPALQAALASLSLGRGLPVSCQVSAVGNRSNQFYSESGLLLLDTPAELLALRHKLVAELTKLGYTIDPQELERYEPHLTVRLGVPLEGTLHSKTEAQFLNRNITFGSWAVFRLVQEDGRRTMRPLLMD